MLEPEIRPYSYNNPAALELLSKKCKEWLYTLYLHNIFPNAAYIWVKKVGYAEYLKIEIDIENEELQLELVHPIKAGYLDQNDLIIAERHFKTFVPNGYGFDRTDVLKENAAETITRIDTLIAQHEKQPPLNYFM